VCGSPAAPVIAGEVVPICANDASVHFLALVTEKQTDHLEEVTQAIVFAQESIVPFGTKVALQLFPFVEARR